MTDLADMIERLEERRELERLREENARLRRELEEERNPLLRAVRNNPMFNTYAWHQHPEVKAHFDRMSYNVGLGGAPMGAGASWTCAVVDPR